MIIVGDDGLHGVFAANLNMLQPLRNNQLFFVYTALDKDDFVIIHKGTTHLEGFADGAELPSAVTGYDDGVGVIVVGCVGIYIAADDR